MKNKKTRGNIMLLLTAFIWGTAFIAQSVGVESIPPSAFNGIRSVLGGTVLIPVILISDNLKKKSGKPIMKWDKRVILAGVLCGIFLCLASTLQTVGLIYTSPGKAGFITALYMVMIPIVNLFMGKKPTKAVTVAVIIAVIGLYMLCIKPGETMNKGDILIFLCSILFTVHIMLIDKFAPVVDGIKLSCLQFFVCGILNIIWMALFEQPQLSSILSGWISIAYAGIMSCGVAYTLQIVGQKYTDPTSASILMSLESVFSTLATVVLVALGWNLTGGALTVREILGCVLMFAAIMFVQLPEKKSI